MNGNGNQLNNFNSINGHANHVNETKSVVDDYKRNSSVSSSQLDQSVNVNQGSSQPLIRKAIYNSMQPRPSTVDIRLSPEERAMISVLDKFGRTDGTSLSPTTASQRVISEVANSSQEEFDLHPENQSISTSAASTPTMKLSISDQGHRNDSTSSKPHTLSNTSMDDVALIFDDSMEVFGKYYLIAINSNIFCISIIDSINSAIKLITYGCVSVTHCG